MIKVELLKKNENLNKKIKRMLNEYSKSRNIYISIQEKDEITQDKGVISIIKEEDIIKDSISKNIIISESSEFFDKNYLQSKNNYCITLLQEEDKVQLFLLMDILVEFAEQPSCYIELAHSTDEKVYINEINYINIEKRNLCYHLKDRELYSKSLQSSFAKNTKHLIDNETLVFIKPSLIINIENIKTLYADHAVFTNDKYCYFPKTAYNKIVTKFLKND